MMINEIKKLRVKIDGISQLVKDLQPIQKIVSTNSIPDDIDTDEFIKQMRKSPILMVKGGEIDINPIQVIDSKELNRCYDSLIFGKAWLGKILQHLNHPSPYKNDGNRKTKEDIEPTADIANKTRWSENALNRIEKVDMLRQDIQHLIDVVQNIEFESRNRELAIARTNCYNYLCEARFWLGFELQRIREEK